MAVDGEERNDTNQKGYKAGSRALDSLDRLITSTESFFHPSNSGPWTIHVSSCCLWEHLAIILTNSADNISPTSDTRVY